MSERIEIVRVDMKKRRDVLRFCSVQAHIQQADPRWVAPLTIDLLHRLNPAKYAYTANSRVALFLAIQNGEPVGRIAVHRRFETDEARPGPEGYFGFFDSIDDQAVADLLFAAGMDRLSDWGAEKVYGPAGLSFLDDQNGVLIEGYGTPPVIGTSYNPPYYRSLIEGAGFAPADELSAYYLDIPNTVPDRIRRIARKTMRNPDILVRRFDMRRFDREAERIRTVYRSTFSGFPNHHTLTEAEFDDFFEELRFHLDPRVSFLAEYNERPVGIACTLVDTNRATAAATGGRFPVGLLRVLARKRPIVWARVPILGVMPGHRSIGIESVLYYKLMVEGYRCGYRHADLSLIHDTDYGLRTTLDRLGAAVYKRYRTYVREITVSTRDDSMKPKIDGGSAAPPGDGSAIPGSEGQVTIHDPEIG